MTATATAAVPVRNQRLYKCWGGELETVLFREQSIAEGAFAETWLVFDPKRTQRIRCSIGSYFTTELEAWQNELASYRSGLKAQREAQKKARQQIVETKAKIVELRQKVAATKAKAK